MKNRSLYVDVLTFVVSIFLTSGITPASAQDSGISERPQAVARPEARRLKPLRVSPALLQAVSVRRECRPPSVPLPFPFQSLLPGNELDYKRCHKEASATRNPKAYRCCVAPRATPTPFPSGACCKAIPGANPGYDCSLPVLNFGHPQGLPFAQQRCNSVNQGSSCVWSLSNPKCCAPGIPGCAPEATPTPRPTATPAATPFPSGACCHAIPGANPGYDCSLPLLNFGHPQGLSFAQQRCNSVNQGVSCVWSLNNPKCCAPGIPGCGAGPTPTPQVTPRPTDTPKPTPTATPRPTATPTPRPSATPTPTPTCLSPSVLIPFPYAVLATHPSTANEYTRCKSASGGNSSYKCCVNIPDLCSRAGGSMVFGSICGVTAAPVFGPVDGKICCKSR